MTVLWARKSNWVKRIGGAAVMWGAICAGGLLADLRPRPLLLAGLCAGLSLAYWMATDVFAVAQPTDWHVVSEPISRPRGADARVVTLERLITSSPDSDSSRSRLQHLLSDLAGERLLSLRGIDPRSDPAGARAVLGPEFDAFITSDDPTPARFRSDRMSLLLNRIESI